MFVVVPIMNSEPFIKVGHRISESSRKFSIRYPNFLIFQRAVNSIMNYYMNSTVVLRIQLHIVMCNVSRIHTNTILSKLAT